jgi:uncharacterized membrane protein YidH (DUF202 family)
VTGSRDRGLQPERTDLAWHRTTFSAAACSVLLLHTGVRTGSAWALAPGLLVAAVAAVTAWTGSRERGRTSRGHPRRRLLLLIGMAMTAACLSASALLG